MIPLKKVLMIDDEELILLTTKLLLEKHKITTICVNNSLTGIALAESEHPDIILLDVMMPDMDGWEVLQNLKDKVATKSIPVVLFTAGDFVASDEQLSEWDVAGVLRKPFHLKELLNILHIDISEV